MDGDKEAVGYRHVERIKERRLRFSAPEQSIEAEQIEALQLVFAEAPDTLVNYAIFSEIERRRLTVELGVRGTHATVQESAKNFSALISSAGILSRFGQHDWRIGH